jgi:leader peptidase (prepilin peptidase) / N-methyltransferase
LPVLYFSGEKILSDDFYGILANLLTIAPILLFILGALLGSFANVVIYRWPKKQSVVMPRSRCPHCQKPISFYDNIPIFSWFILRGRCRQCRKPISFRYVIVELLMAILFVTVYHFTGVSWSLVEYLIMTFGLVTASFIDLDHFLLPDIITLPGIVIGLAGAALNPERPFLDAFFGVLFGGGFLWAIAYAYQLLRKEEGMGGGDIKLLAWVGAVLGWRAIPFVIVIASLVGTVLGLVLAGKARKGLKTVIPFGPYLAMAAILYVCGGETIGQWYLNLFFPGLN